MYSKEELELERQRIRNADNTPVIQQPTSNRQIEAPNKRRRVIPNKRLCVMRYNNNSLIELITHINITDAIGVEFGSYDGGSAEVFLNSGKFKTLYCVDGWIDRTSLHKNEAIANINNTTTNAYEAERVFDTKMKDRPSCVKVKKLSYDAYDMFEDNTLDFVYIDSNHSYESVTRDIIHMLPKLKSGGILSGHDYGQKDFPGVKQAVDELLKNVITVEMEWIYRKL